ncbi:patatin-like phospholipase family protein [Pseudoalteromonas sp. APM04]|uniref:patatin-like phospholipase family protein n=1 Tax=Pseudoalteromonas sp. APM04 TaxID=2699396 RepID=UPI001FB4F9E8|nr:patatin-like phospholipase family protein [Pseudoalteromonas sp. APM04]UOB72454.1 hypothetical protein MTP24_09855 [Pseudoalteromonas sp. APM04]
MAKLGLVFSGGGGKGAYEIGVWKALNEFGIESPRVCQRLNNLRNWNYEKIKSLYIRIS